MRRSKLKYFIALIMCFTLCMYTVTPAMAENNTNEEQIDQLLDKLAENQALSLQNENSENNQELQNENLQIESELSDLGVQKLDGEELLQFFEERGIPVTRVGKPGDTNTVKWFLYTSRNISYGSQKYDVQRLIAQGNNPGGMLVTGEDNVKFYSGQQKLANAVQTAVSIYVQKAIGLVPFIQWTPYELLFSSSSSNAFNSSYVTHRCVSSIEFSYVKPSSASDSSFGLCKFSNKLTIAAHAHGAAVVNSKPYTYSDKKTQTVSSDNYGSTTSAIKAYINGTYYDYIPSYQIKSYGGQYSKTAYVPNPLAGPGQIY